MGREASFLVAAAVVRSRAHVEGLSFEREAKHLLRALWLEVCDGNATPPNWLPAASTTTATEAPQAAPVVPDSYIRASFHHPYLLTTVQALVGAKVPLAAWRSSDGQTALHHTLVGLAAPQLSPATALQVLAEKCRILLYAGVPLNATTVAGHTATEAARLAIQRHRTDSGQLKRSDADYLTNVERVLEQLETLQAAGGGLVMTTEERDGTRCAVVSAMTGGSQTLA